MLPFSTHTHLVVCQGKVIKQNMGDWNRQRCGREFHIKANWKKYPPIEPSY